MFSFQVSARDSQSLWALITYHGGRCQRTLTKDVTHLVCSRARGVSSHTVSERKKSLYSSRRRIGYFPIIKVLMRIKLRSNNMIRAVAQPIVNVDKTDFSVIRGEGNVRVL